MTYGARTDGAFFADIRLDGDAPGREDATNLGEYGLEKSSYQWCFRIGGAPGRAVKSAIVAMLLFLGQWVLAVPALAEEETGKTVVPVEGAAGQTAAVEEAAGKLPARNLVGTPWKELPSSGEPRTRIQNVHYLLFREGGELAAVGECAHFWGKYRLDGGGALLITEFRAKRTDCSNAAGGDQGFVTSLIMADAYRIEGTELALYQSGKRMMVFGATTEMPAVERTEKKRASAKAHKSHGKASRKKTRH